MMPGAGHTALAAMEALLLLALPLLPRLMPSMPLGETGRWELGVGTRARGGRRAGWGGLHGAELGRGGRVAGDREVPGDGRLSRLSGWMRRMGTIPSFWTRRRKTPKTQRKTRQQQRQIWRIRCRLIIKRCGRHSKKKPQKMCWKRRLRIRCRLVMACCPVWVHQRVRMQSPAVPRTQCRARALSQTHHTFMRRSGTQLEYSNAPPVATEDAVAGNQSLKAKDGGASQTQDNRHKFSAWRQSAVL